MVNIKRYAAFACDRYYPCGGMRDDHAWFDTLEEAREWVRNEQSLCGLGETHIWDAATDDIIEMDGKPVAIARSFA